MYCWDIYLFPFCTRYVTFFVVLEPVRGNVKYIEIKNTPDSVTLVHPTDELLLSNIDGARLLFLSKNTTKLGCGVAQ